MTYAGMESSVSSGRPVELYAIGLGLQTFRYNTSEVALTVDGNTYAPLEISRTTLEVGVDHNADAITITLPASTSFVRRYIHIVPGQLASLSILRYHPNDPDEQTVSIFRGIVRSVGFTMQGIMAQIVVQPLTSALSRTIPRYKFMGQCNHDLYGSGCSVPMNSFRHIGQIDGISGAVYTIRNLSSGRPNGWANNGFMMSPNGTDFRMILSHTGDNITLLLPFGQDVGIGPEAQVFAGCDRSMATCVSKFNNGINYGGFPWVPRENVFVKGLA